MVGKWPIFLGDEGGTSSVLGHRGGGHRLIPEPVHKIIMDGIERHRLDAEIEDDHVSDPFGTESKRPTAISFSWKTSSSEGTEMNFEVFISINLHTMVLS
jgi:hypothetical protein